MISKRPFNNSACNPMSNASGKISVNGGAEIIDFFRQNQTPLFYVSTTVYNMLGAEQWIDNLSFINTVDSFDGRHPRAFVSVPEPGRVPPGIEAANNYLLANASVAEHVRGAGADA